MDPIYALKIGINFHLLLKKNQHALFSQPTDEPAGFKDHVRPRLRIFATFCHHLVVCRKQGDRVAASSRMLLKFIDCGRRSSRFIKKHYRREFEVFSN